MKVFWQWPRKAIYFWIALVLTAVAACSSSPFKWAVYYGRDLPPTAFDTYDLLILDPNYPFPLQTLKEKEKIVIAYISIGEVMESDPAFAKLKAQNLILSENTHWKGSHTVDVRSLEWERHLLDDIIPTILAKGYQGLMLDTVDSPLEAERANPKANAGMQQALVRLIRDIHARYPTQLLVMNRGYQLLPDVANDINYLLAESTFTHFDIKGDAPRMRTLDEQQNTLAAIQLAQQRSPKLKVLALEYWKPLEAPEIGGLYKTIRNLGFYPYISTIRLDSIPPEPK